MPLRNTTTSWGTLQRVLHWGIAVLVLGQLAVGDLILLTSPDAVPTLASFVHPTVGIVIGAAMIWRLAWRERNPVPAQARDAGATGQGLSLFTHYAFYALLIANPVIGYLLVSFQRYRVHLFTVPLPFVTPASSSMGTLFFWFHLLCGAAVGLLFLLHAGAALVHEFLLRDNVLRRMLGFPAPTAARAERQGTWPVSSPFHAEGDPAPEPLR